MGDNVLTYNQICFIAERICGICGFVHSCCYCQAVEEAAGIEIPKRAKYIRTIMLELERVHSHLLWIGLAGHILGFDTIFMQAWRIREPIMWICERITGNRKNYGMNLIGGVRRDIPKSLHQEIYEVLDRVEKETKEVVKAIEWDASLNVRLSGVGVLKREVARDGCVVGPTARGSGIDIDIRKDHPYAAYDELDFEIFSFPEGDIWSRTLVRINELFESIRIIRQALKNMPDGEIIEEVKEIPPGREAVSSVEAPRGEAHHYILTGPNNRPYRWRVRAPTYANIQIVPKIIKDQHIADVPITIASLDPCFSCTERIAIIDKNTCRQEIFTLDDFKKIKRC
jgi:Ni,Fe-hydrogenase III large subunit